ncbi:DUF2846 domain-containing protein [Pseudomonas sp. F1_0610]|uniref:DUF2846 domain-containing protein n=1 Tax=Pseudomonas sp. F1_0610 TaxID=3114284 RepID=UPI0039C42186
MFKKLMAALTLGLSFLLIGCSSIPMETAQRDHELKRFPKPPEGKAAVYIYRDSFAGQALRKKLTIDGEVIGKSANKVFFYQVISPGQHRITTESEFGDNELILDASAGVNYFVRQYMKIGVFVSGSALELMDTREGKYAIFKTKLAKSLNSK